MVFELSGDEIRQVGGEGVSNNSWVENHPWESAGIAIGTVLGIAIIGLNVYTCYKRIIYGLRVSALPYEHPLKQFDYMQRDQRDSLRFNFL